jgi:hypothetical protein
MMVDVLNSSDHTASGFSLVKAVVPAGAGGFHSWPLFEGHLMIFLASRSFSRDNGPRLSYNDPMPRIRSALTNKT